VWEAAFPATRPAKAAKFKPFAQTMGVTSNITLITRGNHQAVSIVTPGTEVPEITVSLERK